MTREAPLVQTENGLVPVGDGWFVVDAREARWGHTADMGSFVAFEGDARFPELGINVAVIGPGQPSALYHAEDAQEDFFRYPANEVAQKHGAGVPRETSSAQEAYAPFAPVEDGPYREGDLPD